MPGLPTSLDRIVEKAMAKEPSDRYGTALDMANELSAVRAKLSGPSYPASVSLSASVTTAIEMAKKTERGRSRNFAFAGGGAVAALLLLIGWSQMVKLRGPSTAAAEPAAAVTSSPSSQSVQGATVAANPATQSAGASTASAPPLPADPQSQQSSASEPASRGTRSTRAVTPPKVAAPRVTSQRTPPKPAPQQHVVSTPATTTQAPAQNPVVQQQQPVITQPAAVVVQRPPEPKPQEAAPPPAAPTPATKEDLTPIVEAYARAIESKDIGAIRRVYPGLTADQARNWTQFFQAARNINVTFRIANVDATGTSADARLVGTYDFLSSDNRTEHQPEAVTATFHRENGAWRLVAIR
jgi:serine/threonine-protein kinase